MADLRSLREYNDGISYLLGKKKYTFANFCINYYVNAFFFFAVAIDVFTRYLFVAALKSKKGYDTLEGFKEVLFQAKHYPETVLSDR